MNCKTFKNYDLENFHNFSFRYLFFVCRFMKYGVSYNKEGKKEGKYDMNTSNNNKAKNRKIGKLLF